MTFYDRRVGRPMGRKMRRHVGGQLAGRWAGRFARQVHYTTVGSKEIRFLGERTALLTV